MLQPRSGPQANLAHQYAALLGLQVQELMSAVIVRVQRGTHKRNVLTHTHTREDGHRQNDKADPHLQGRASAWPSQVDPGNVWRGSLKHRSGRKMIQILKHRIFSAAWALPLSYNSCRENAGLLKRSRHERPRCPGSLVSAQCRSWLRQDVRSFAHNCHLSTYQP